MTLKLWHTDDICHFSMHLIYNKSNTEILRNAAVLVTDTSKTNMFSLPIDDNNDQLPRRTYYHP